MIEKLTHLPVEEEVKILAFIGGYERGDSTGHCYSSWQSFSSILMSLVYSFGMFLILVGVLFLLHQSIPYYALSYALALFIFIAVVSISVHLYFYYISIDSLYSFSQRGKDLKKLKVPFFKLIKKIKVCSMELCIITESLEGEATSIVEILEKDEISLLDDLSQILWESLKDET